MLQATRKGEARANSQTTLERTSNRELVIARTFSGRARIVFDALTQPELLKRWWAPCSLGVKLLSCEADLRVGGAYRYVFGRDPAAPVAFSGVYKELVPHSRIIYTQIFEPVRAAGEALVTVTLEERDGKTHMVQHALYPSKEALDGAIASGMEHGARETMEQLEALVASIA